MTYLDLMEIADEQIDRGEITYEEYKKMIEPLRQEIQSVQPRQEIQSVQPRQKEITMNDVKTYCEQRNLVVIDKELFDSMNNAADKFYLYLKSRERM